MLSSKAIIPTCHLIASLHFQKNQVVKSYNSNFQSLCEVPVLELAFIRILHLNSILEYIIVVYNLIEIADGSDKRTLANGVITPGLEHQDCEWSNWPHCRHWKDRAK